MLAPSNRQRNAVLALDLGGTKLTAAIVKESGQAIHKTTSLLNQRRGNAVGRLVTQEIGRLLRQARDRGFTVRAVGISVPGVVHAKGRVWAPNIPGWKNYPLQREVESVIGRYCGRIVIESDRACYVLGEAWKGAARECRNVIFLAVGTGIGAGIMMDGRVLRGAHGIAGAIGWLALDRPFSSDYKSCGCFEYYASGEGLANRAKATVSRQKDYCGRLNGAPSTRDVFAAYRHGDQIARRVISDAIQFWGMAVANLVSLFDPEKIIFGGGVFGPATQFMDRIYSEAKKWGQPISVKRVSLLPSKLGPDAGLLGAAALAFSASVCIQKDSVRSS